MISNKLWDIKVSLDSELDTVHITVSDDHGLDSQLEITDSNLSGKSFQDVYNLI